MKATKKELREEIHGLRSVGGSMSNVCFNLGQDSGPIHDREMLAMLAKSWDAIKRAEPTK